METLLPNSRLTLDAKTEATAEAMNGEDVKMVSFSLLFTQYWFV